MSDERQVEYRLIPCRHLGWTIGTRWYLDGPLAMMKGWTEWELVAWRPTRRGAERKVARALRRWESEREWTARRDRQTVVFPSE